jgi:hypothetical protein
MAFTASLQQAAESVVGKVKTADRRVVIAAASAAALTVAWYATKFVLSASNSERHLNDDQKALLAPRRVRVSDSREVAIEAIKLTPSSLGPAADCLAAKNADDPMMVACGAEVRDVVGIGFVRGGSLTTAAWVVRHSACIA